ncbi:MAG: hypothetical protein CMJ24_11500 [Phycisphaerae bacterium]|nr:hypothetical protein [Phycisphaerae bacterium]MDG1898496.1 protein-disulfide reductase DsbD family protein [Phycisphaerales bacterium]
MFCILLALSTLLSPGGIPRPFAPVPETPPVVSMHVEGGQVAVVRGGTNHILCTLDIPDGYHIYWRNPGASGSPTQIEVTTPMGYEVDPMRWPRPEIFSEPEGRTYGYSGSVTFVIPFRESVRFPEPGTFEISARWLACKKACFMGSASKTLRVSPLEHVKHAPTTAMKSAEALLPRPLAERASTLVTTGEDRITITGSIEPGVTPGFVPDQVPGVELGEPLLRLDQRKFELVIPYTLHPDNALGTAPSVRGLLLMGMNQRDPSYRITIPIRHPGASDDDPSGEQD